jgi:hypothetical protein
MWALSLGQNIDADDGNECVAGSGNLQGKQHNILQSFWEAHKNHVFAPREVQ